ncbi:hypothetical protein ACLKA6_009527 [Drosophila palustris]
MLQIGEGKSTFSTSLNEANYDASLDPLVWSRPFVQDTVRRHRTVSPQLNHRQHHHHHYQQHHLHYHRHHHHKPCPELIKRRRQQSIKWLNGRSNTNYKKYLLRRRKLMLPTRC